MARSNKTRSKAKKSSWYRKYDKNRNTSGAMSVKALSAKVRNLERAQQVAKRGPSKPSSAEGHFLGPDLGGEGIPFFCDGATAYHSYFRIPVTDLIPSQQPVRTDGTTVPWNVRYRNSTQYLMTSFIVNMKLHFARPMEFFLCVFPKKQSLQWEPVPIEGGALPRKFAVQLCTEGELNLVHPDGPFRIKDDPVGMQDDVTLGKLELDSSDGTFFGAKLADIGKGGPIAGAELHLDTFQVLPKKIRKFRDTRSLVRKPQAFLDVGKSGDGTVGGAKMGYEPSTTRNIRICWNMEREIKTMSGSNAPVFEEPLECLVGIRARKQSYREDFEGSQVAHLSSVLVEVKYCDRL